MPSSGMATLIRVAVSAWLGAMALADLKSWKLPHWGTTWLLAAAAAGYALGAVLTGRWVYLALPMAFVAVLLSDTWLATLPAGGALALAWGDAAMMTAVLVWLVALGLVLLSRGATGAGDAKLVMAQIALFPDPTLAWLLAGGVVLAAAVESLRRDGRLAPWIVLQTAGAFFRGQLPARPASESHGAANGVPIAHYLALPGVIYVWFVWNGAVMLP